MYPSEKSLNCVKLTLENKETAFGGMGPLFGHEPLQDPGPLLGGYNTNTLSFVTFIATFNKLHGLTEGSLTSCSWCSLMKVNGKKFGG